MEQREWKCVHCQAQGLDKEMKLDMLHSIRRDLHHRRIVDMSRLSDILERWKHDAVIDGKVKHELYELIIDVIRLRLSDANSSVHLHTDMHLRRFLNILEDSHWSRYGLRDLIHDAEMSDGRLSRIHLHEVMNLLEHEAYFEQMMRQEAVDAVIAIVNDLDISNGNRKDTGTFGTQLMIGNDVKGAREEYFLDKRFLLRCSKTFESAEPESQRQFVKYNRFVRYRNASPVQNLYFENPFQIDLEDDFDDECLCLGKIMEEELNASVIQLIRRKEFGIDTTKYFRKFDDTVKYPNGHFNTCKVETMAGNGRRGNIMKVTISNLNFYNANLYDIGRNRNYRLQNQTLGCIVKILNCYCNNDGYSNLPCFSRDFIDRLNKFANCRNTSAHAGGDGAGHSTRSDFEYAFDLFSNLWNDYSYELMKIKTECKSGAMMSMVQ